MIKKHLVFHFFIPEDYETNIAVKMHYACLHKYAHVFDSAEFFVSTTKETEKYLKSVKMSLVNLFDCDNVRIVHVENDDFYESRTFKENVVDKLEDFEDTLVFFGHNKGTTNVNNYQNVDNFLKWIYALYFYSLEFTGEMEKKLLAIFHGRTRAIFGSLMNITPENDRAQCLGTFFWLNPMQICLDIKNGEVKIPKMAHRCYAEHFPWIYTYQNLNGITLTKVDGHNCVESRWAQFDFYSGNFDDIVRYYGEYDMFMENYNETIRQIL